MIRMQSWRKLELIFWTALPSLITLLLVIFYLAPKHIPGLSHFMPILPLIPVFYWGLMHAREMPFWFVFALGLIMDAVTGMPMGLTALLYVFFLAMLHAQRKYIHKEGFIIKWGYFAMLLAVTGAIHWLLMLFLNGQGQGVATAMIQWLLTVCCYPLFHRCFDMLYGHIHSRRWQLLHGR
jgi:rod shape-determining protein MreD